MNAQAFERLMLENRLRRALENGELVVYYQPQVSLRTGEVVGVEALVRWFHPELGLVPPGEFIPLAEDTGLILPIGFWAMETACVQVATWQRELERPDLRLAVNLSARQFQHAELAARIAEILERTGFTARCLELELTESVVMREASESMRRMRELTALGLALSIDDFGTGYSSLAYLRSFPIRSLKIDRSFVQDVDRDPSSATIVQAIVAMGASLGLNVVAEGVETSQQLRQLRRMGCHEMQGFLVSRALPAADLLPVLRDGRLEDDEFLLADGG
jgi:EAL domain-containing protein (putative c-di-GMP-specific phosphodiesterase class I)